MSDVGGYGLVWCLYCQTHHAVDDPCSRPAHEPDQVEVLEQRIVETLGEVADIRTQLKALLREAGTLRRRLAPRSRRRRR